MDGLNTNFQPSMVRVFLVAAIDRDYIMGNSDTNTLPWHYPEDLEFFKRKTTGPKKAVVMGFRTWESLPVSKTGEKLPGRFKIVLSRGNHTPEINTIFLKRWELKEIRIHARLAGINEVYLIGGANLFSQALSDCEQAFITHINDHSRGNLHFPWDAFEQTFGGSYTYETLSTKLKVETYVNVRYNRLIKSIYEERLDRQKKHYYYETSSSNRFFTSNVNTTEMNYTDIFTPRIS